MQQEDPNAWNVAARLAGAPPPAPRPGDAQRGQGWRIDVQQRRAIEDAAMDAAKAHYEHSGYRVKDVHREKPYDLCCTRGTDELHVEVKGTASNANAVLLTAGEVRHARTHDHTALFVLGGLHVMLNGDEPVVTGGDAPVIIDPWVPAEDDLEALEYRYMVPCRREDRLAPSP